MKAKSRNIALKISFDGSCFHGWQFQDNALTVQESLQNSWLTLTGESIQITGSSRTDSGVHAKALVANFQSNTSIPEDRIHLAFNSVLPDGLSVLEAKDVNDSFNARFDSIGKHYSYYYYLSKVKPTYERNMVAYINQDLNISEMQAAIESFIGEKDFACFMDQGSPVHSTVRTIMGIRVKMISNHLLRMDVFGDGFLYHMVRIIAGTLLYVGNGKIAKEDLEELIRQKDRKKMGKTMPPQGLFLNKVYFKKDLFGQDSYQDLFRESVDQIGETQ